MQSQLSPGQRVMTTAGLFATISAIEDDAIVLETSPGVTSRWTKAAIARVMPVGDNGDDDREGDGEGHVEGDGEGDVEGNVVGSDAGEAGSADSLSDDRSTDVNGDPDL